MESILVVEDDPVLLESIVELLRDHQYLAIPANCAAKSLEEAGRRGFHLVLSDVRLAGGADGVSAIESIRQLQPHIRSIIMTGYADLEVPLRAARVQADDYLHKPFSLDSLLDSIRSVLDREQSPFRASFTRPAMRSARDSLRLQCHDQWLNLNLIRELCLKRFYLLIRAQRLQLQAAYLLFCRLEALELRYLRALDPTEWAQLNDAYQALDADFASPPLQGSPSPTLPLKLFQQLYQKINEGQLESIHLQRAIALLHDPEARRANVEAFSTYHWIWCSPCKDEDPLLGLRVEGYKLTRLRSAASPQARLYDTDRGDIVLCIPEDPANQPLLQREQESGRVQLLKSSLGHHFLLYRGESSSLKRQLPPEGMVPRAAWALLKPVYQQVYQYHQQGRSSGSFSLNDIDRWPGQPPQLVRFESKAYEAHHRSVQQGQAVHLDRVVAPEAFLQPSPTTASDQAVLGRLMVEAILGSRANKEFPGILFQALGEPYSVAAWQRIESRLAPLSGCLFRMCLADPQKRYSDLKSAAVAVEQALAAAEMGSSMSTQPPRGNES